MLIESLGMIDSENPGSADKIFGYLFFLQIYVGDDNEL